MSDDPKALAAQKWFGYGRWGAPYWFVGKEPGDIDGPEPYASWLRLGGGELIDCRQHDLDCASPASPLVWHGQGARLQPTWRPLIALLLAYYGSPAYNAEAVRSYQNDEWGTLRGETALVELSAIAAPSTAPGERLPLTHQLERISTIRDRIADYHPRFVLFYGGGTDSALDQPRLDPWTEIAGVPLVQNTICERDRVVYVATPHPMAHGISNEFWTTLGHQLACS